MTFAQLVAELHRRGVSYWTTPEGKLHLEAPPGVLAGPLRAAVREHRDDLLFLCRGTPVMGRGRDGHDGRGGDLEADPQAAPAPGDQHAINDGEAGASGPAAWADPRPDLAPDTALWGQLLEAAFLLDGDDSAGLFGALHGLRCCGARLARPGPGPGGWRIRPGADYLGGREAWEGDRAGWLLPQRATVTRLLLALRETPAPAPREASASTGEAPDPEGAGLSVAQAGVERRETSGDP
jgi:hypothetical protein